MIVTVEGKTEKVQVEIHWAGGHKTCTHFIRPVAKLEQLSYYHDMLNRVKKLKEEGKQFAEIAEILNQEGWHPAKKQVLFNKRMVNGWLSHARVKSNKKTQSSQVDRALGDWTFQELSEKTSIPETTLYAWMRKGLLQARRVKQSISSSGIWLINADENEVRRLRELKEKSKQWVYRSRIKKVD